MKEIPHRPNGRLTGLGASPGLTRGRARLVSINVVLPDLAPGDILVAQNAGPLWTPFFPILGGLVLDQGTFSQHAAATAREYGIPAVIEAGDATRRIPDGAWLSIDGVLGTVEIIDANEVRATN
jgi:pyruvate,water dikinase